VKNGIPVRWTIILNGTYLMGIKVPQLGINQAFNERNGQMTFEFTPTETGNITFTCPMGMHPGRIGVN
jgi:plastocyanin domain-containing protein